ncbi:MAG: tyrosine recombinase XerC [Succinivibrionaceae bacterium]
MMGFSEACERFTSYLRNERNLSSHTVSTYRFGLDKFREFITDQGITGVSEISSDIIRSFVSFYRSKGIASASINVWLAAIKSLFRFLQLKSLTVNDPTLAVGSLKKNKRLPSYFSDDQMSFMLDQPATEGLANSTELDNFMSVRDKAMIELMYSSGLRVSELVSLDLDRVYLDARQVKVVGKGSKERIVPMGIPALKALNAYLDIRNNWARADETALFVSKYGTRTTSRNVEMRLKIYARTHSVGVDIYPHKLRHSFATAMVSSSHNVRAVQELLGHERLSTTQIYSHTDIAALARVYEQAHPRDRMEQHQTLLRKTETSDDLS